MKIPTTEKEFELAASRALISGRVDSAGRAAVVAAREAGLEFAPEPPQLPSSLQVGQCGPTGVWIGQLSGGDTFTCRDETARPLAEELVARYNAYPVIRAAAAELCRQVKGQCAANDRPPFPPLRHTLDALEAELAKGPK